MATISILANTVRPSINRRSDDNAFGARTFSWQDPVHSWKAGPDKVTNVENLLFWKQKNDLENQDITTFGSLFANFGRTYV